MDRLLVAQSRENTRREQGARRLVPAYASKTSRTSTSSALLPRKCQMPRNLSENSRLSWSTCLKIESEIPYLSFCKDLNE